MSDWLEKMGVSILKTQENAQEILEKLVETARPTSVFAPPVTAGEYTIITASEVYAGMGMGFGGGGGSGQAAPEKPSGDQPPGEQPATETKADEADLTPGSGVGYGGGGGGMTMGRPVAAITIGPDGVSVEPIADPTKIAIALFTTLGAMALMFSRMAQRSRR